jgi:thioredoxin reductase
MNQEVKDVVMIGAGPSALAAAIYTTRENISTVLYENWRFSCDYRYG